MWLSLTQLGASFYVFQHCYLQTGHF